MRTFKFNKKYFKDKYNGNYKKEGKINLPIKSLEINLADKIRRAYSHFFILFHIVNFINHEINDKDRIFLSRCGSLKATLLFAYGNKHRRFKWRFVDNRRPKSILKWIRGKDGKFDLIIVMACNPGKCSGRIETKNSLLVVSTKTLSLGCPEENKVILIKPKNSSR